MFGDKTVEPRPPGRPRKHKIRQVTVVYINSKKCRADQTVMRSSLLTSFRRHVLNPQDAVIAHAGSDGTRRRTGGEVKGKDANGVGSQSSCIHTPHSSTASS